MNLEVIVTRKKIIFHLLNEFKSYRKTYKDGKNILLENN